MLILLLIAYILTPIPTPLQNVTLDDAEDFTTSLKYFRQTKVAQILLRSIVGGLVRVVHLSAKTTVGSVPARLSCILIGTGTDLFA